MWKFKVSKFKNAAPVTPKFENCITDLNVGSIGLSGGQHIKASTNFIAFNTESGGGGALGIVAADAKGRQPRPTPTLKAHADNVSDFDFSPFNGHVLATGSQDCTVKIWSVNGDNLEDSKQSTLCQVDKRVDCVTWHPLAEDVLAVTHYNTVGVYDAQSMQLKYECGDHGDMVYGATWSGDGQLLGTSCKDKQIRIIDPRSGQIVQTGKGHSGTKESKVKWLGNHNMLLSTGFNMSRQQEVKVWDSRNLSQSLESTDLDSSSGTLLPHFDPDTNMLFLTGKGDNIVRFMEITEKEPYITQGSCDTVEQLMGACLVPKLSLDVMICEVNRLLLLTKQSIIPITYKVPRKSYTEFHEDLFPETAGEEPSMTADAWWEGSNAQPIKVTLDPNERLRKSRNTQSNATTTATTTASKTLPVKSSIVSKVPSVLMSKNSITQKAQEVQKSNVNKTQPEQSSSDNKTATTQEQPAAIVTPVKPFTGVRQSKFRHLVGTIEHKSLHIDNIRNISRSTPGESDFFQVNTERCVVPLAGKGGLLAVLELNKPGRLPDTGVPVVENTSSVSDFVLNPFDNTELAVGCEDAKIRIWWLPEEGVTETLTEPDQILSGHTEKVYCIRYHPLAKYLLASASYDMTVRLWDTAELEEMIQLTGHTDSIFCLSWSTSGDKLATACKDGKLRIYQPRTSTEPIQEGPGPEGSRGARITWACNDQLIIVSGFSKSSNRQLQVYRSDNISVCISTIETDLSPSIQIPHYDEDSSTLFLTGRGDNTVVTYEVSLEEPYIFPLSPYKCTDLHQAVSFLPKSQCNVKDVEFAKGYRLTTTSIQPLSFTVPRVKKEYFQDDLFPDTRMSWEPALSASEWFQGIDRKQPLVSLAPDDMKPLSQAPVEAPKVKKYESYNKEVYKTDEQKKEELLAAMTNKLGTHDEPLPQDLTEGVDDDEWDD
ncbi:unnamed protein product [Owenia fusiformis]|uniref:Coronin n=1 Tax=Owenia fusiformis TaxID=6347 RepID=A0A8J1TG30_OWEFU|nr:unnamed protein product [Owenia fusiformis]